MVNFALPRSILLCLRDSRQSLGNEKLNTELKHTSIKDNELKLLYKQLFCFLHRVSRLL